MSLPIIDKEHQAWHLAIFFAGSVVGLGLLIWHHATKPPALDDNGVLGVIVAVMTGMAPVCIVVAAGTVTLIEGVAMIAERYRRAKFKEGRQKGVDEMVEMLHRLSGGADVPDEVRERIENLIDEANREINQEINRGGRYN